MRLTPIALTVAIALATGDQNAVTEADPGAGNGRRYGRCTAVAGERGTFLLVDGSGIDERAGMHAAPQRVARPVGGRSLLLAGVG